MQKVVITGATSMIGIALLKVLLSDEKINTIYAVVRKDSDKIVRIPNEQRIKIISCDMDEYNQLPKLIAEECDTFYHLAWPRTSTYEETYSDILYKSKNIQVILEAMRAASVLGCKKFIGAGSQCEYGVINVEKYAPDTVCQPVRADGILHLAASELAKILARELGISFIWMRIFSAYGEFDRPNSMISTTIRKLLQGEHCAFTLAEQRWDYCFSEDIARAFYLVGGTNISGIQTYCVGYGEARPLREYIEIIRDIVAPEAELNFGELPYPDNPIMNLCADISALNRDTGWTPEVSFEKGIRILADSHNYKW